MDWVNLFFHVTSAIAEDGAASEVVTEGAESVATASSSGSMVSTVLTIAVIFAVFYFLMIRPQRKKDKKTKQMLSELKVTDDVCTIGGIYGTVTAIKDDVITLSVGKDHAVVVVARWAIRNIQTAPLQETTEELN